MAQSKSCSHKRFWSEICATTPRGYLLQFPQSLSHRIHVDCDFRRHHRWCGGKLGRRFWTFYSFVVQPQEQLLFKLFCIVPLVAQHRHSHLRPHLLGYPIPQGRRFSLLPLILRGRCCSSSHTRLSMLFPQTRVQPRQTRALNQRQYLQQPLSSSRTVPSHLENSLLARVLAGDTTVDLQVFGAQQARRGQYMKIN